MKSQPRIILASASPRRKDLLTLMGLDFEIIPSPREENIEGDLDPADYCQALAYLKASDVSELVHDPTAVIIGGDTIVVLGQHILEKPKDEADAAKMLTRLSGKTHQVITGLCILQGDKMIEKHVITEVTFRKLSPELIKAYIQTGEPMGKAGAYAIQGKGSLLIKSVNGDYSNVVGLPVAALADVLVKFGITCLPKP